MRNNSHHRIRRTQDPQQAVQYFLETAVLKLGFRALVLADQRGALVACAGTDLNPTLAAQSAPAIFRDDEAYPEDVPDPYFVEPLPAQPKNYYLMAMGQSSPAVLKSSGTITGIRRILNL